MTVASAPKNILEYPGPKLVCLKHFTDENNADCNCVCFFHRRTLSASAQRTLAPQDKGCLGIVPACSLASVQELTAVSFAKDRVKCAVESPMRFYLFKRDPLPAPASEGAAIIAGFVLRARCMADSAARLGW